MVSTAHGTGADEDAPVGVAVLDSDPTNRRRRHASTGRNRNQAAGLALRRPRRANEACRAAVAERTHVSRNVVADADSGQSFGQRAADAVASFGGSWIFVGLFGATMLLWVALNALLLATRGTT